jgi:thiol-disulfide isomerase/thioredoxin
MRIGLIAFVWLSLGAIHALAATPGEVPIGGQLREARLYAISGPPGLLSAFRGKPLIINVWASWCGPCRLEMGSLQQLSRLDAKNQFRVIGISTDDDAIAASEYVAKSKLTFENFVDYNLTLENMLGANTIPLTVLVDAKGQVLAKIRGSQDWTSPAAIALLEKTFRIRIAR